MQLQRYRSSLPYTYTLGAFPTLEGLRHQPRHALRILVHSGGERRRNLSEIRARCDACGIPLEINDEAVTRLSHKGNVLVIGVFEKYPATLREDTDHLMLVAPQDPGNVGTILRTALGFGVRDIALVAPEVDPFNPHVVRASLGARFALNVAYFESLEHYLERYRESYNPHLYPFLPVAEHVLGEVAFLSPFTLIFGPEWPGLPESYRELGRSVSIPQSPAVESLNLAVAVGIALYETRKS